MKREIKFRAWDKFTQKYWNIENWHFEDEYLDLIEPWVSIADPNSKRVWRKFNEVELMQYTGLKDKNGKNIYEGDIVMWGDMAGLGHEKPVRVAVVRFDPDICFDSNVGIFDYGNFAYKETDKYLTVIGNIYENPDLLEADK